MNTSSNMLIGTGTQRSITVKVLSMHLARVFLFRQISWWQFQESNKG